MNPHSRLTLAIHPDLNSIRDSLRAIRGDLDWPSANTALGYAYPNTRHNTKARGIT